MNDDVSEAGFQAAIMDMAAWCGWRRFHPRAVRTADARHLTAFAGESGFPDLVLVHRDRGVIFAELKSERGKTTPGQRQWLNALEDANAETYLWRPQDFDFIVDRLRGNDV